MTINDDLLELRILFSELELSDQIEIARNELETYLNDRGYVTKQRHQVNSDNVIDVVAKDDNMRLAILIGRHSVRMKRISQLRSVKGFTLVYLLRGDARIDHATVNEVNVINVMSKGKL